jgi:putative alpha-1,2-mannosidase
VKLGIRNIISSYISINNHLIFILRCRILKRVDVVDSGEASAYSFRHLTVFYTGLVRALSFPRRIDEINEQGEMVHYSPYDPRGRTFNGPLVTDNGFWDTFRTVYPMLSLLYPDMLGPIIQGIYPFSFIINIL